MKYSKPQLQYIHRTVSLILFTVLTFLLISGCNSGSKYEPVEISYINLSDMNGGITTSSLSAPADNDGLSASYLLFAESEQLRLYADTDLAGIAIVNKQSGYIWKSNLNKDEAGHISGIEQMKAQSQIAVDYSSSTYSLSNSNSYRDAVQDKQFHITSITNGVRIEYFLGSLEMTKWDLPEVIEETKYRERIQSLLDENEEKQMRKYYRYNPDMKAYVITDKVYGDAVQIIFDIFQKYNYTAEDISEDMEAYGSSGSAKRLNARFLIEYTIAGDSLIVNVPTEYITNDDRYIITDISLLEYFGAVLADTEGYVFLPSGTGAVVYFDNSNSDKQKYLIPLYGNDPNRKKSDEIAYDQQGADIPVFGLKVGNDAMMAVMEEGASLAAICYEPPINESYCRTYFKFVPWKSEVLKISSQFEQNYVMQSPKPYLGNIRIRYTFFTGNDVGYVDFAKRYRNDYLNNSSVPSPGYSLMLDAVGSVTKVKGTFVGPARKEIPFTSLKDTVKMTEQILNETEAEDLILRYSGWIKGGLINTLPRKISPSSVLGSKNDFLEAQHEIQKRGVHLYYDLPLLKFHNPSILSSKNKYATKTLDNKFLRQKKYQSGTFWSYGYVSDKYFLNPKAISSFAQPYTDNLLNLGVENISLSDMGNTLYSAGNRKKDYYTREDTLNHIVSDGLAQFGSHFNIMLEGSSAYALPYSTVVTNIDLGYQNPLWIDESVPFVEILLRGHKNFAYDAYNLSVNPETVWLRTIATGASPFFRTVYTNAKELQDSEYMDLYSGDFITLLPQITALYKEAHSIYSQMGQVSIKNHSILAPGVQKTVFDNNMEVIVNYSEYPYSDETVNLAAKSYTVFHR